MRNRLFEAKRVPYVSLSLSRVVIQIRGRQQRVLGKTLKQVIQIGLYMVLLFGCVLGSTLTSAAADPVQQLQPSATHQGMQLPSSPAPASNSAIVNFEEKARQDASKPKRNIPPVGIAIHPHIGPPEPESDLPPDAQWPMLPEIFAVNAPSPSPAASFAGLDDIPNASTNFIYIPPDTDGAVGLTKIMEGLNNNYRILDKATGATINTVSTDGFWSAGGGSGFFDPKTIYDPINNRWIIVMMSGAGTSSSSINIGVSLTSDPSGSYFITRVVADGTGANWADFPTVGFNRNWVAVNVNMFSNTTNFYVSSQMLVVDYAQLRAGTFSGKFITGTGYVYSPAATYSSTESTLYVVTHLSSSAGTYRLDTITGTPASPVYTIGATKNRGLTWVEPGGNLLPQAAPLSGASVCGATPCVIEVQDPQIRSTPVVRDGFLYYSQTVGLPAGGMTHTGVQWTKLDASGGMNTGNVADGGRVEDPTATSANGGKWYAYPHISVNHFGDIVLGFSQFASNQYPSAGYTFHGRTDAAGLMNDAMIYKAGEDYYHKDFGSGRNRWGDYSKAQVDPSNDTDLWALNEYAKARVGTNDGTTGANSSRWGTWWSSISLLPADVAVNLGISGLWLRQGGTWSLLTNVSPNKMATYGHKLIANFLEFGLYEYDGITWKGLTATTSVGNVVGLSDMFYADFTGIGIWQYNGAWNQITSLNPTMMAANGNNLLAVFSGVGLYQYDGTTWTLLASSSSVNNIVAILGKIYADFTSAGIWAYDGMWTRVASASSNLITVYQNTLIVNFPGFGLYRYDGGTWTLLTPNDSVQGLLVISNNLFADFGTLGLWQYNGAWTQIAGADTNLMASQANNLVANFPCCGLWQYDGSTWSLLTVNSDASDMVAVPLP